MNANPEAKTLNTKDSSWRTVVAKYQHSDLRRSLWQAVNSFIPYLVLCFAMYRSLEISYWLTLALSVPAAGFMTRIFIIFHDCGHGAFFKSQKANDILGFIGGVITFTPYYGWRYEHAVHHATAGDLDRRGLGDVWTLTVKEYLALPPKNQLWYRIYRNPFFLFILGPLIHFLIKQRFPSRKAAKRERHSVHWTNLALAGVVALMSVTIGIKAYILIQFPTITIASAAGVWLFYVQHQYEGVYWERHENWDYVSVALEGSSYYKLPKILQWFTGNIGLHHVHHLSPRIPNYFLEKCHNENPMFHQVKTIGLLESVESMFFRLWDEEQRQLVGFGHLKSLPEKQAS